MFILSFGDLFLVLCLDSFFFFSIIDFWFAVTMWFWYSSLYVYTIILSCWSVKFKCILKFCNVTPPLRVYCLWHHILTSFCFNKVFAKLGSDMKKPKGLTVIDESNHLDIIKKLKSGELKQIKQPCKFKKV